MKMPWENWKWGDWDEPELQLVASYGDLAVLLICVFAIVLFATGSIG